jgi:hypothetical protein
MMMKSVDTDTTGTLQTQGQGTHLEEADKARRKRRPHGPVLRLELQDVAVAVRKPSAAGRQRRPDALRPRPWIVFGDVLCPAPTGLAGACVRLRARDDCLVPLRPREPRARHARDPCGGAVAGQRGSSFPLRRWRYLRGEGVAGPTLCWRREGGVKERVVVIGRLPNNFKPVFTVFLVSADPDENEQG